jgi:prolyl-tRNA synthetase
VSMRGEQELGISNSKNENPGEWYAEVVKKAEIADYSPVGGFIIVRPRGISLWESIRFHLDSWFRETGVENAYFPVLIPEKYLEREKEIIAGFDPEVAWVTHGGEEELGERLAVRPTSESIIAPFMARWVRSHRDLPLRLNQWCSVVRWEATETKPFFRTKEFLWQEGHTAHKNRDDAWAETIQRLDQYERLYREILAIPVLKGRKPEHDKFPGAETTSTVEALMPDGKSVQGGTSHYLGTTFSKAFEIGYVDENEENQLAHTTSWGLSWRAIGALIMTHSDDQGLVLPPAIAPEQIVIVPIWKSDKREEVMGYAREIQKALSEFRVELDDRDEKNPGFKFNEWELKGVPIRIEIGPKEVENRTITLVHRPDGERHLIEIEGVEDAMRSHLEKIYEKLYQRALDSLQENIHEVSNEIELVDKLTSQGGYAKTPWCGEEGCEETVKEKIAASIVMIPPETEGKVQKGDLCSVCGSDAKEIVYFAKKY